MEKITSFKVDHRYIDKGIYVSRIDDDITTYDLRTRKPNGGEYMDNITMHTFEPRQTGISRTCFLNANFSHGVC